MGQHIRTSWRKVSRAILLSLALLAVTLLNSIIPLRAQDEGRVRESFCSKNTKGVPLQYSL
jgi:hypothetical protein